MKHAIKMSKRWVWIWLLGAVLLCSSNLVAEEAGKIVVLNSDASIGKYAVTQEEFEKMLPEGVKAIDLGRKKWDEAAVEEFFYDEDPDLIYCIGTKAYLLAHKYGGDTPIVFSSIINWLRLPRTEQTYGVSNELHAGMEMMLLRYVFPEMRKIGILYSEKYTEEWFRQAQQDAVEMGFAFVGQKVSDKKQVSSRLAQLLKEVDAYWLISDPTLMTSKEELFEILDICHRAQIPVFSYHEAFASFGAVLTVSVDDPTIGRQAAGMAAEVLAHDALEEKVQFPAGSYIVLNLKRVKEYGLSYNEDALGSVNDILE
jgi:putative ABC transport system substrate-binding protein